MSQECQDSSCRAMTDREKLEWLVANKGDCHKSPFECSECPLDDDCLFDCPNGDTALQAKARLYELDHQPWTKAEILQYLVDHGGDCGDLSCKVCPFRYEHNCDSEDVLERAKVRLATGNKELEELVVTYDDWEDFDGKR